MSHKLLKKLKEKEENIMDAIYELQEFLDHTEDPELSSMGDTFSECLIDFMHENDTITINEIREFIEKGSEE